MLHEGIVGDELGFGNDAIEAGMLAHKLQVGLQALALGCNSIRRAGDAGSRIVWTLSSRTAFIAPS